MVLKYKDIHAFDNYKTMEIIYSMYRAAFGLRTSSMLRAGTQRYSRGGWGTIYPGSRPAGVTSGIFISPSKSHALLDIFAHWQTARNFSQLPCFHRNNTDLIFFSRMYWSDIGTFTIASAYMNGTGLEVTASGVEVYGLALDHTGIQLYPHLLAQF